MKSIDKFNIGLIIVCTIIYFILCSQTKYKSVMYTDNTNKQTTTTLTDSDYRMLYFTTVYGFIYGAIIISFQQRYLIHKVTSIWIWILILFISILLVFTGFYSQIYTNTDPNLFMNKFSYAILPILPSLVILAESAISEVLEHGFKVHRTHNFRYDLDGGYSEKKLDEYWYLSD